MSSSSSSSDSKYRSFCNLTLSSNFTAKSYQVIQTMTFSSQKPIFLISTFTSTLFISCLLLYGQSYFQRLKLFNTFQKQPPNPKNPHPTCNIYRGEWVYHPHSPLYTNSCVVIPDAQNCRGNGRPDNGYEKWRWKPNDCDLPRFDVDAFLNMMRNKTIGFVGDSVARNQMQSLVCILMEKEKRALNKGYHTGDTLRVKRWHFRPTSTIIARISSAYLLHTTLGPLSFAPKGVPKVHLDVPDKDFMSYLPNFDVVIISSGHWFAKQAAYVLNNTIVGGQLWWPNDAGPMRLTSIEAFAISVKTVVDAILHHPNFTGLLIVRSYSPSHYKGGAWNTGGSCMGHEEPDKEVVRDGHTMAMYEKQKAAVEEALERGGEGKVRMVFMDVTDMSGYRRDGHPGPYRSREAKKGVNGRVPQDCLHWCMPGAVDTWNEILFHILKDEFGYPARL